MLLCLNLMAQAKKKTTKTAKVTKPGSRTEQKVSAPKKTTRKSDLKVTAPKKTTRRKTEETFSEVDADTKKPKTKVITRGYMYAVLGVLVLIGLFFAVSRFWIVAWVDNKPITKFELDALLEKRDQGKTTEELIVERLVVSEGKKQKLVVSDAETDAEVKKIEDSQGGAEQLDQILKVQQLSREDFRKLVELQLLKQKLFGGGISVSDEELEKYITDNKDSLPAELFSQPNSSEAAQYKNNLKEQLKQMKINENFNKWLTETISSSRVVKN